MLLARYFHTLRHLRPVQVYGWLWFRLYRPRPDVRPAPPLRASTGPWIAPPSGEPRLRGPATLRLLNQTRTLAGAADWNRPDWDKLWLYNLHYFDDLNAESAAERQDWQRALIARWIAENPPGHGNGWEPYPLSLRIVNWIQWAQAGNSLEPAWMHSLAIQVRYLTRRLERHLLGNHLFANAKALIYAGLFFAGPEADRRLHTGLRILDRQLPEQILPDGGHFERSPMYHALILKDVLDLLNLARVYPEQAVVSQTARWGDVASRLLVWLQAMTHPDGEIAFFNDAAFGIAPTLAQLADYAERLGIPFAFGLAPLTALPDSGYIRLQADPAVLILDAGPVGPDYLPGHAHADTLSFELSLFGQRVIVNSGTSCYGTGPERQRQRSTAAHNTVVVAGQDSSEVWGGFRVARRAWPLNWRWSETADGGWVECAHDGYQRLPGRVTHGRRWTLNRTSLRVEDRLEGRYPKAVARLYFHPTVRAGLDSAMKGWLELPDGQRLCWNIESGGARLIPSTWHPRFGVSEANVCLEILFNSPEINLLIQWQNLSP